MKINIDKIILIAAFILAIMFSTHLRSETPNQELIIGDKSNNCRSFTDGSVLVSTIGLPPPREDGKYCFDINTKEHVKCPEGMGI